MNPHELNRMSPKQAESLIELLGTCVDVRYEPKYTIYLYSLAGVFVEAYYHRRAGFIKAEGPIMQTMGLNKISPNPAGIFSGTIALMSALSKTLDNWKQKWF